MLYFAALAFIGLACAAFRWQVMFCVASLVFIICCIILSIQGALLWSAVLTASTSFIVVQISYVLGGALLSLRLRRVEAKKNLKV